MRRSDLRHRFGLTHGSGSGKSTFQTGQIIPESGIYKVIHLQHRLPHEVTLLRDQEFPKCSKCGNEVKFELVRPARELNTESGHIVVYQLPELESKSDSEREAAA